VWNYRPQPDELLRLRLQENWRPTLSSLQAGDRVLGYAACLSESASECPLSQQWWRREFSGAD